MVARSRYGDLRPFPVAETKHRDSILMTTEVPANVSYHVLEAARKLALDAVSLLDGEPAEQHLELACVDACCSAALHAARNAHQLLPTERGKWVCYGPWQGPACCQACHCWTLGGSFCKPESVLGL